MNAQNKTVETDTQKTVETISKTINVYFKMIAPTCTNKRSLLILKHYQDIKNNILRRSKE